MALWTSDPSKTEHVREYFSSINSMAARIVEVQSNLIKSMPKEKWMNMSATEQEKALDQCIITPEAAFRYRSNKSTSRLPKFYQSVFPKLIVETGQEYATRLDDSKEKETWKDEHSDPFSWETRSQMNMPLPSPSKEKIKKKPAAKVVPGNNVAKTQQNGKVHHAGFETTKAPSVEMHHKPRSKISARLKNGADLEPRSIQVELFQSNYVKPVLTDGPNTNLAVKQETSTDGPKQYTETKSSGRTYLRSSVTENEDKPLSFEDTSGAIRHLKPAMKEKQKVEEQVIESAPASSISVKPPLEEDTSKFELIEESPLLELDTSPSIPFDLEATAQRNSLQKSGFDFLDNW